MTLRIPAVLLAVSVLPLPASGQQDSTRAVALDTLAVSVTRGMLAVERTPAAVSALDIDDIQGTRLGVDLDEALGAVPGLLVNNRYNFALGPRIAIRGFGTRTAFGVRGIRVIADGIPLTMPDGQTNLNNLDLGSAGTIEVLRGPASAAWGNAAGGVVLVRTERAPPGPLSLEARATMGDMGRGSEDLTNLTRFQVKAGGSQNRFEWLANVSRLDIDGYREHARGRVDLLNATARWMPDGNSQFTAVLSFADYPVAENPGSLPLDSARNRPTMAWPANVLTGSGEETSQFQAGVVYARTLGPGRLDASVYGLDRSLENPLPFAYIQLDRTGTGTRLTWAGSHGRFSLSGGTDLEMQRDGRREFTNVGGAPGTATRDQVDRVTAFGPFVQSTLHASPRVDLTVGARWDLVRFRTDDAYLDDGDDTGERNLSSASWFTGVTFAASERFTAYANAATSFQTPTTTELINAPPASGGVCCPGGFNSGLDPQDAISFELGMRARPHPALSIEASVHEMRVHDAIVPFQVEDGAGREFFRNAAETVHRGLELGTRFARGPLRASAAWTWSDYTFEDDGNPDTDFEGNRVPGATPHHLHVRGSASLPFDASVEVQLDHTAAYPPDDANTAPENPAATVIDVRLSAARVLGRTRFEPFLALRNLTDERYFSSVVVNAFGGRYYEPAPGRNVYIGLRVATGGWAAR